MSVATLTESRTYGRLLTSTSDAITPGIRDCIFQFSPIGLIMFGESTNNQFGALRLSGRGKRMQNGGASVEVRHRLGKNATVQTLPGPWGVIDTTPQDNVRFSRANWVHYSGAATISETEKLVQQGDHAIAQIVTEEVQNCMNSLADLVMDHVFSNASDATRITSLQQTNSAGDSLQGLSGSTYTSWNSRGFSLRNTAPASVTFDGSSFGTSDSFASAGLVNLRLLYDNASEGAIKPDAIVTTYLLWSSYEALLQAQMRYTGNDSADGAFRSLEFDQTPVFKDPKCTAGELHMLNFETLYAKVLSGADFTMSEWHPAEQQESYSSHCMFKAQLVCEDRRRQNKWTGATA